jgi:hypothetical protein
LNEIVFESGELRDLCDDVFDLCGNVADDAVMCDGSLCCWKHGLFLRK